MTLTSDGPAGLQHAQTAFPPHARFTVGQFHRLCEAVPELRLELVDGEVLEVIAKGSRHTAVLHRLARAFTPLLERERPQRFELRIEAPLDLGVDQEPEPDLALVRARPDAYFLAHPTAASTALVIEVADRSLAFDLDTKLRLYREAGIPNYWVIDVQRPAAFYLLQQRQPDPLLEPLRDALEVILGDLRSV
jgi:Uma2 family endonuclease